MWRGTRIAPEAATEAAIFRRSVLPTGIGELRFRLREEANGEYCQECYEAAHFVNGYRFCPVCHFVLWRQRGCPAPNGHKSVPRFRLWQSALAPCA